MANNQIVLTGNVGNTPELIRHENGFTRCHFSLATDEIFSTQHGEKERRPIWHRIVVTGSKAALVKAAFDRGDQVTVQGRIRYRTFSDREGFIRRITEILASDVKSIQNPFPLKAA